MRASIDAVLDRQRDTLVELGYPAIMGVPEARLVSWVDALRPAVGGALGAAADERSSSAVPLLLVVAAAPAAELVPLLRLAGSRSHGIVDRNHGAAGLVPYRPLPELAVPTAPVYAILDVERGEEYRGVPPQDALPVILAAGRSPLTIHEGIALVTHFPRMLEKNRCFMLSGSRRGDRRVPAMWISGGAPKLGWCWDGNPHDWLGTASAGARVATDE